VLHPIALSNGTRIVESIRPARWCLTGSFSTTPGQLLRASVIRRVDALSPRIKFAKMAQSILPVVEVQTPSGNVTLLNVKILDIAPAIGHEKGLDRDIYELEQWDLTYQKIDMKCLDSKSIWQDDWNSRA